MRYSHLNGRSGKGRRKVYRGRAFEECERCTGALPQRRGSQEAEARKRKPRSRRRGALKLSPEGQERCSQSTRGFSALRDSWVQVLAPPPLFFKYTDHTLQRSILLSVLSVLNTDNMLNKWWRKKNTGPSKQTTNCKSETSGLGGRVLIVGGENGDQVNLNGGSVLINGRLFLCI